MSWVIVPFMPMEAPYDEFTELIGNIHEWWSENGKNRERVGELMLRLGMRNFFQGVGLTAGAPDRQDPPGQPLLLLACRRLRGRGRGPQIHQIMRQLSH